MNTRQTNSNRLGAQARGGIPPGHGAVFAACLAFLLAGVPVGAAFAQCGQGNGSGADIRGCIDGILDEQTRTIDLLDQMTEELAAANVFSAQEMSATKKQLGFLRSRNSRGKSESAETTDDEFANFAIKSGTKSECTFELHPKFAQGGDRTCTDQDLMEGKCREVCTFSNEEKGRNIKRAAQVEDDFAEVLEQTQMANDLLEDEMESMTARATALFLSEGDPCAIVDPHPVIGAPFPPVYTMVVQQVNQATVTIDSITHNFCNQTAGGFNTSVACAVSSAATGISNALISFVFTVNGNYQSATVSATLECAKSINGDIGQINGELQEISQDLDVIKLMLGKIDALLNTPQGLRKDFPTK